MVNLISTLVLIGCTSGVPLAAPRSPANMTQALPIPMPAQDTVIRAWGVRLRLPSGVRAHSRPDLPEDFEVLHFMLGRESRPLLGMYVGNHPSFGDAIPPDAPRRSVRIGPHSARSVRWTTGPERQSGEVIIRLHTRGDLPSYAHLWYSDLPPDAAALAEQIILSIRADAAP